MNIRDINFASQKLHLLCYFLFAFENDSNPDWISNYAHIHYSLHAIIRLVYGTMTYIGGSFEN